MKSVFKVSVLYLLKICFFYLQIHLFNVDLSAFIYCNIIIEL